jgi:hypothetical protein
MPTQTNQASRLPRRTPTSPVSRVVCWRCRRSHVTLHRVLITLSRVLSGKPSTAKNPDYICSECMALGFYDPPTANMSYENIEYRKEEDHDSE